MLRCLQCRKNGYKHAGHAHMTTSDFSVMGLQVQWSTTAGGPYTNLANGQTRAYIQVNANRHRVCSDIDRGVMNAGATHTNLITCNNFHGRSFSIF